MEKLESSCDIYWQKQRLFKKEGYTMKFLYVLKVRCFEYCSQLVKGLWPFWVPFTRAIITKGKFECSTWWHSHTPCIWSFPILSLFKTLVLITQRISPFLPKGVFLEFPKKDFSVWKWLYPFILLCKDSNLWPTKYFWWQSKILFLLNGGVLDLIFWPIMTGCVDNSI